MSSLFSRIIDGSLPGVLVYQDEHCVVLMDAFPMLPGHTLVIPRQESSHLCQLPCSLREHLFIIASRVAEAQAKAGFSCGDTNILLNDGKVAGQSVPHVHIHVVPRRKGDGFPFPQLPINLMKKVLGRKTPETILEQHAKQIAEQLEQLEH